MYVSGGAVPNYEIVIGFQDNLDAVILFLIENFIAVRRIFQSHTVRDNERWINLALLDFFQQRAHIFMHERLPGLNR